MRLRLGTQAVELSMALEQGTAGDRDVQASTGQGLPTETVEQIGRRR